MEKLKSELKLCLICMKEHVVETVILTEIEIFKQEEVSFNSTYEYCDHADELIESEDMIKANSLSMKDAYRKKINMLTSSEIVAIREKYKVSQKDFSQILDWGKITITRYENHQIQDRAHDDVLRKIDSDPKWFLEMLHRAKDKISDKAYNKYHVVAQAHYTTMKNQYLIDSIRAIYANFDDELETGGVKLNLNKVIEIINYFATRVKSLHKVKLMKMLWYSDSFSYKKTGKAITGLVYTSLQMGAVPIGCDQILNLDGINFETVTYSPDHSAYRFYPIKDFQVKDITSTEIDVLDRILTEVGAMNSEEIIRKMHNEQAYKSTEQNCIILFSHSDTLSIE